MSETEQRTNLKLNLEKLPSLSFTEPLSFRFSRCQPQDVDSWRDLYGGALKHLCQKHFAAVQAALPAGEIGDLKASKKMRNPYWVRRGIYAETGLSADVILRRIKEVLPACGLSLSDLKIIYYIDEERKRAYEERVEREKAGPRVLQLRWEYTGSYKGARPVSFRFMNHRTKTVKSWIDLYVQFVSYLADECPKVIKDGTSFGDTRVDIAKAGKKKKAMQHPARIGHNLFVETFGSSSALIDRMYGALTLCKIDPAALVISFTFPDADRTFEYLGKSSRVGAGLESETIAALDGRLIRRLRFLLGKYFEDGYRLDSAIDRKRLLSYYEDQYKEPLSANEEELRAAMLTIASPIGGRISPKKQNAVSSLMKEVMSTINKTFSAGASCIYTSELMKLYQNEIEQSGIHDIKSLEELIMRNSGNVYQVKYNRICYGRRKVDVRAEISNYLQQCGCPQALEEIIKQFWYIPPAVVERELSNADEIVSPAAKTYYSALNLPIKNAEKNLILESIHSFLAIQPSMTEIELLDAVLQICPQLLTEVSFLSWKGLRDSLGFLFRDVITIRDTQVLAK